uniref:Uncharacterized protein n=1 Tax=Platysiphonia delicata TaxID=2006979 RepID=A0A1Z1M1F5_9FLOR|nr:hypothetical protein [Platysiphonia delicata]ARW59614.1 hypothetical protein [Platysiphonia delicata]
MFILIFGMSNIENYKFYENKRINLCKCEDVLLCYYKRIMLNIFF